MTDQRTMKPASPPACGEVEQALADGGDAARALWVLEHVSACAACSEVARGLALVDGALPALARLDASDALVARTLRLVAAEGLPAASQAASASPLGTGSAPAAGSARGALARQLTALLESIRHLRPRAHARALAFASVAVLFVGGMTELWLRSTSASRAYRGSVAALHASDSGSDAVMAPARIQVDNGYIPSATRAPAFGGDKSKQAPEPPPPLAILAGEGSAARLSRAVATPAPVLQAQGAPAGALGGAYAERGQVGRAGEADGVPPVDIADASVDAIDVAAAGRLEDDRVADLDGDESGDAYTDDAKNTRGAELDANAKVARVAPASPTLVAKLSEEQERAKDLRKGGAKEVTDEFRPGASAYLGASKSDSDAPIVDLTSRQGAVEDMARRVADDERLAAKKEQSKVASTRPRTEEGKARANEMQYRSDKPAPTAPPPEELGKRAAADSGATANFNRDLYFTNGETSVFQQGTQEDGGGSSSRTGSRVRTIAQQDDLRALNVARGFLATRAELAGLRFQKTSGEYANTYLPGDPAMRLLAARLREAAATEGGTSLPLPAAFRQPLDLPREGAVGLDVHADHRAVEGPTRMLLQVGLRATERQAGVRPAMGLAVVLDLRQALTPEAAASARALVNAVLESRQSGDRISLWVANHEGARLVAPDEFRNGPVALALERALGNATPTTAAGGAAVLSLPEALAQATAEVAGKSEPRGARTQRTPQGPVPAARTSAKSGAAASASGDPVEDNAPATGAVLLVTAAPLGSDLRAVVRGAHAGAVLGVPTSVVALGAGVPLDQAQKVAFAGQGSLRALDAVAGANPLVDAELHAGSRIVARALRLKVRLAPGVKLVGVLGSRPLDRVETRRVREAEKAEDRRLARTLGIAQDRDRDEDSIRIAIPAFYSGDTHVVLLDVVAERPGPVADVTLKYKDLVEPGNRTAAAGFRLESGSQAAGPLEARVLKNAAAVDVAADLGRAAESLRAGDVAAARASLGHARDLEAGLVQALAPLRGDADLGADVALLETYERFLDSPRVQDAAARAQAADALGFAASLRRSPTLRDR